MANFNTSVSTIQRLVGNHALATVAIVGEAFNKQHADLLESGSWSRKKTEILVPTVADKSAGTIAVTNGSAAIVGTSTSFATADEGRYIILSDSDSLYVLKSRTSATGISLGDLNGTSVNFPGTTASGLTYTIFTRWYSLTAGIEQILGVTYQNKIEEVSQEYLDWLDPTRTATGSAPTRFCRGPRNMSGANDIVRLEFHPRPSSPISIRVAVLLGHTDLSGTSNPIVPSQPIEWLAAEQICYYLFSKTKEEKWLALGDRYQKRGGLALEKAIEEDSKKFGLIQAVQDVASTGLSGDFAVDHDV